MTDVRIAAVGEGVGTLFLPHRAFARCSWAELSWHVDFYVIITIVVVASTRSLSSSVQEAPNAACVCCASFPSPSTSWRGVRSDLETRKTAAGGLIERSIRAPPEHPGHRPVHGMKGCKRTE